MKKIPTRDGAFTLHLEPAPKILPRLRDWFPDTWIVGWKHELDGDRSAALAKGAAQTRECRTDACVVNGEAYGTGFGILLPDQRLIEVADKAALGSALVELLSRSAADMA